MSVRFIHTADWQLGMRRRYLGPEAQARFTQARFDAIVGIGRLAEAERCDFVVVSGDVFESNQVDRQTVIRAVEALRSVPVPVYLLPGNHDPLDAASVYDSASFTSRRPSHVQVLRDPGCVEVAPGVDLVAAPWYSKKPLRDLVGEACRQLAGGDGRLRIVVGHGGVDELAPDVAAPALIATAALEQALENGCIHFVALGDRHSLTPIGSTGRIWYAGAPEATDHDQVKPGHVLVVDLDAGGCSVAEHRIGVWTFVRSTFHFSSDLDVERVKEWLHHVPDKASSIARLTLVGQLGVRGRARLEEIVDEAADAFAAVELAERGSDLVVLPDDLDFEDLGLSGFAENAVRELVVQAGEPQGEAARDALGLLYRLCVSTP